MDLIDRYLAAITRQLPEAQKSDVTAELRDVLLSQVEDEETRLGRAQTREELEALLIRFGHPMTVAGRYRKTQHLIGPEIFPFWWAGIKTSLLIVAGTYLALIIVEIVGGRPQGDLRRVVSPSFEAAMIFTFGAVTLFCALAERFGKTAFLRRWKPGNLPPALGRSRSAFDLTVEIAMGVVFILWWVGAIRFRDMIPDHGVRLDLAPVWTLWFWPILGYGFLAVGIDLFALVRPARMCLIQVMLLARHLMAASILTGVYQAGHWVTVSHTAWAPDVLAAAAIRFDAGVRIGLTWSIVAFLGLAALSVWRLRPFVQASPHARVA